MVRLNDVPAATRTRLEGLDCPQFDTRPWVAGPPRDRRRVAIVSTAGLMRRGDRPFSPGGSDYRVIPANTPAGDLLLSHVSVNFDRTGFEQDINVVFPIDRLRELVDERRIGSIADHHYSFMGATDPGMIEPAARSLAGPLKADGVDAVVLLPV